MKTLYIVRHAKSSWDDSNQPDIERPLNKRGLKMAPEMGKLLKKKKISPQVWVSSPAVRAFSTAELFAKEMGKKQKEIIIDDVLYSFKEDLIIKMIEAQDNKTDSIMLFFHNPSASIIASYFTGEEYVLSTCAVVGLELYHDSWQGLVKGCAREVLYEYPKKYDW